MLDKENVGSRRFARESVHQHHINHQLAMAISEGARLCDLSFYEHATAIFSYLTHGSVGVPPPIPKELASDVVRRVVYELAFGTWRYRHVLSEILEDSDFFFKFFHLREMMNLLLVMLFDYQQKQFPLKALDPPSSNEICYGVSSAVEDIATALQAHRTKLNAAVARARVAADSRDMTGLLPEEERNIVRSSQLRPLCVRINMLKTNKESIVRELQEGCWLMENDSQDVPYSTSTFMFDPLCPDTLMFSSQSKAALYHCQAVKEGKLVIEDKVESMVAESIGPLIGQGAKVIITCVGNGNIVCRLAALMNNTGCIYAFEALPDQIFKLEDKMKHQGVSNVVLLSECFTEVYPDDSRFEQVTAIIIVPPCTNSTVINHADYVMIQGDEQLVSLPDDIDAKAIDPRIPTFSAEQKSLLTHALMFQQVQAVVYCTRSKHYAENEAVVESAMETCRQYCSERNDAIPDKREHIKHFQLYTPDLAYTMKPSLITKQAKTPSFKSENSLKVPLLDFSRLSASSPVPDCYLKVQPSSAGDGCFLAILQRIAMSSRAPTPAREVLRRAVAKGLISDLDYLQSTDKEQNPDEKKTTKKVKGRIKRKPSSSLTKLTASAKSRFALTTARLQSQYERKLHDRPFRM